MKSSFFSSRRNMALLVIALIVLAVLLAPTAAAATVGRFVAGLWVATMSAVVGLLGGFFGH